MVRPGERMKPRVIKARFHVRTLHGPPFKWLHSPDEIGTGTAQLIRIEWCPDRSKATAFPSKGYAKDVANRSDRKEWPFVVVPAADSPEGTQ
jgi:hypothetical protein